MLTGSLNAGPTAADYQALRKETGLLLERLLALTEEVDALDSSGMGGEADEQLAHL